MSDRKSTETRPTKAQDLGSQAPTPPWWVRLSDEELLDVRICDLGLTLAGTALEGRVGRLQRDLARAGLRFRPYVWLSTDWYTPDASTGFALPFFLAHPRLARLEFTQMFEVEGGNHAWCMKLLRHETGHTIDNAYRLRRRKSWRETFGRASEPYRETYVPNPSSRHYVINLDNWYAQSHPVEDFAETVAVWLQPHSRWRRRYRGWPAVLKLEYVDSMMREIADQPPRVRTRARTDEVSRLRITLREYYRRKKAHYGEEDRSIYDRDLTRLFSAEPTHPHNRSAVSFLRQHRQMLRRHVAAWTGQYQFVVDDVLSGMIIRAGQLGLRLRDPENETSQQAAILLTVHTMQQIRRLGREYYR